MKVLHHHLAMYMIMSAQECNIIPTYIYIYIGFVQLSLYLDLVWNILLEQLSRHCCVKCLYTYVHYSVLDC